MEEVKKYGVYPGFLTKEGAEAVKNGDEFELYATINSLGAFMWRMNHDAADGRIDMTEGLRKDLSEAQYSIEFAVLHTKRFGVEIEEPKNDEHVPRTESYMKWFAWWNNYIRGLSDEEWHELERLRHTKQDYSKFRPSGDWK